MVELTLNDIHSIQLDLLKEFINICDQNDLNYSLGGGSLLGCIRHKGFIPWDDDIDLMMPRKDYQKFYELCQTMDTKFNLHDYRDSEKYYKFFMKISNKNTYIVDNTSVIPDNLGVAIDIFPIDHLGNSRSESIEFLKKTKYLRELMNAYNWKKYSRSKTKSIIFEPVRYYFYLVSRIVSPKKLMNKVEYVSLSKASLNSKFSGCIYGSYREKEIMASEVFNNYTYKTFENIKVKIIRDYDIYLKNLFGTYMEWPPKEKQITHHTYRAFWR